MSSGVTFKLRRDTAANWVSLDPVLALAEPGLETDTRKVKYGDGATPWNALDYSAAATPAASGVANTPAGNISATDVQSAINELDSEKLASSALDIDPTLAADSDARVASQKATRAYVAAAIAAAVAGLFDLKSATDCSGNPNYPAASKGDAYVVSVAGKIGGAAGLAVDIGDVYVAEADNAGGAQASVGASWFILEHNLAGALLAANNLSDLADAATARGNLGLGTANSPQFTAVNLGHATDTTVARASAGDIAVEGNLLYRAGGTDVPIADGGTGASAASAAATNLGLGTGDSPQFAAINVGHATDSTITRVSAGLLAIEGANILVSGGALGTPISATLTNATGLPISTGVSGLASGIATFFATASSGNLAAALTDETGTGACVFADSPTITTALTFSHSNGFFHISNTSTGAGGIKFENSGTLEAHLLQTPASGLLALNAGRGAGWGGSFTISIDTTLAATFGTTGLTQVGRVSASTYLKSGTYTVATLPSASASGAGAKTAVTDALAPTFGATVAGGGAVFSPVTSDGTNWKVG